MRSTPCRLPVLLAILVSICCASCWSSKFVSMEAIPYNGRTVTQTVNLIRKPLQLVPLPEGDVMIMHVASDDNIQIQRLDDSLNTVFQYTTLPGDMDQKPLGLIRHKDMLLLFAGEYDGNDSMYVILRHIATADGTERKRDTILRFIKEAGSSVRTEFAMVASPDSSKVLVYNFDIAPERAMTRLPVFADAMLIDLSSGRSSSLRSAVPMPADLRQAGYDDNEAPASIVYHVMLANDGRTYFTFPGPDDALGMTCMNFEQQTSNTITAGIRSSACVWQKPQFCRPHALLDVNGDLLLAGLDYTGKKKLAGISVARFSGRYSSIDQVKHHSIDTAAIAGSLLEDADEKFITVAMVPNPVTRGYTVLFQQEKQDEYKIMHRSYIGYKSDFVPPSSHDWDRFLYGDIYGIAFDETGEKVWEKKLIWNKLLIIAHRGPHLKVEQAGDSLAITYLSMTKDDEISVKSATFSQRNGTGSGTGPGALMVTVGIFAYVDLSRSFFYNRRNSVLLVDGTMNTVPQLVRVH